MISNKYAIVMSMPLILARMFSSVSLGPFIYDVRRNGVRRGEARVDACGRGRVGSAPCGRSQRKLEPTDLILSSPHVKKSAF